MLDNERLEKLKNIFSKVDPDKSAVIDPLLTDVAFLEKRLEYLRSLPHLQVSKKDPHLQRITAAGKQYKETMQAYLNAVKVLQMTLSRFTEEDKDEFEEWLQEARK